MLITKVSTLTKKEHKMEIPVTPTQIANWLNGTLIHIAMPNISKEHREFILTGITPEEWKKIFGQDEKN